MSLPVNSYPSNHRYKLLVLEYLKPSEALPAGTMIAEAPPQLSPPSCNFMKMVKVRSDHIS
jgi:hypothetical protein